MFLGLYTLTGLDWTTELLLKSEVLHYNNILLLICWVRSAAYMYIYLYIHYVIAAVVSPIVLNFTFRGSPVVQSSPVIVYSWLIIMRWL